MKRSLTILSASMLLAAGAARADGLPDPPLDEEPAAATERVNLCEHKAVREVAKVEKQLRPAKELVGYVTNPTGFALKMVNDHVVHIPKWVGIAMDPRGYVRGKAVEYVRKELRKSVGVDKDCEGEIEAESSPPDAAPADA
jgi:hypothetical protein